MFPLETRRLNLFTSLCLPDRCLPVCWCVCVCVDFLRYTRCLTTVSGQSCSPSSAQQLQQARGPLHLIGLFIWLMWLPLIPVNQVLFVLSSRSAAEKKFRRNVIRMLDLTANSRPSRSRVSTAAAVSSSSFSLFTRLTGKKMTLGRVRLSLEHFFPPFFCPIPF